MLGYGWARLISMIEGLLRHCTDAEIESNHVDTHDTSVVGFAFTELLNFRLLPRLKNAGSIPLYRRPVRLACARCLPDAQSAGRPTAASRPWRSGTARTPCSTTARTAP
ncbi:putative transposase [Streptomyces bottropensis ATCC 25435]|uniref:Putative transposase n=1 Tax=Streptomyces bottropensis ATCC 25435 TaxID=1054862 RepID=M3EXC3_9ACTN|nr:putative transposase [Streptomyces bottropensis ATCC 25435]